MENHDKKEIEKKKHIQISNTSLGGIGSLLTKRRLRADFCESNDWGGWENSKCKQPDSNFHQQHLLFHSAELSNFIPMVPIYKEKVSYGAMQESEFPSSRNIRRSLKRPGADLEQASSKKSKPTEAPKSSVPDESQQPSAEVPPTATQQPSEFSSQPTVPSAEPRTHSYGTRRKSLGARKKSSTELDLTADDRSFIRVLSDDSDDSNDDDDPPIFWPAFAAWEVVPTGLGDVNALYFMDKSSKYFTHLREILHLVDRKDLFKLYGMVVQYYEEHPLAGSGMILWGDLQVLFESHEGGTGAGVWADQQQWVIRSWRLFPFSGVHVLETISGKILYMLADTPYPLSAQLMKKMLKHKLEVEIDGIGNDLTYAEQLIQFIKNQAIRLESIEVWFQFPEILEVAAFGIHADNCHMVLQRFLIQEVWRWFHDVVVQSSGVTMTDLSRKLEVNFVKFKFRGGLLGIIDFVPSIVPAGSIFEPVLMDDDEDRKRKNFEEEEPKEDDDMEVEDMVEPEDETVPASVHEVGESSTALFLQEDSNDDYVGRETAHALVEKKGKAKDEYYGKLILNLGNEVRSSMEEGMATMEILVRKLGNAEEKPRVGFVFKERPNKAIDVMVEDEKSP
ncbi:hypothetical protein Tco_1175922 [Tanacetum coccineum]